jgi:hypothetical protein
MADRRATDRLLRELLKSGFVLTGVLWGPPSAIVELDGPYPRSLVALLSDEPAAWHDHLAAVVAPHAGVFRWWQVGPDGDHASYGNSKADRWERALGQLREAMERFITVPQLAVPLAPAEGKMPSASAVEEVTLAFGDGIHIDWYASEIDRARDEGPEFVSAFIEPLEPVAYSGSCGSRIGLSV